MVIRNMQTPRGMQTLGNLNDLYTRDRGPVQLCPSSNTRVLGGDGA